MPWRILMTHDELLEKVKDNPIALAVVEFHKPYQSITLHCQGCDWSYPCDTIEVIEKELK
jgi:hypothetical protein